MDGYLPLEQRNLGFAGGVQLLCRHLCHVMQQSLVDLQAQQIMRQTGFIYSVCMQPACTLTLLADVFNSKLVVLGGYSIGWLQGNRYNLNLLGTHMMI